MPHTHSQMETPTRTDPGPNDTSPDRLGAWWALIGVREPGHQPAPSRHSTSSIPQEPRLCFGPVEACVHDRPALTLGSPGSGLLSKR